MKFVYVSWSDAKEVQRRSTIFEGNQITFYIKNNIYINITNTIADLVRPGGASSLAWIVNINSDVTSWSRKLESLTLTIPVSSLITKP